MVKYVFVPADSSKDMEERVYEGEMELGNDGFQEMMKEYFATAYPLKPDENMLRGHWEQQCGKDVIGKVDPDALKRLMYMQTVDIFPVLLPTPLTQQRGVSIYVDDKGISKNLPVNERLSAFVRELGYPGQTFCGDAFVGRVHDSEADDIWKREDFTMEEISSNADWVAKTKYQTANKKSAQEVADFKKQFTSNPVSLKDKKPEDRVGEEKTYRFRDCGDELELTFSPQITNKKKIEVVIGAKKLYVAYEGEELFGKETCARKKIDDTSNAGTPMDVENSETTSPAAANKVDKVVGTGKTAAELFATVDHTESSWSVVDKELVVTLMKKESQHWPSILAD